MKTCKDCICFEEVGKKQCQDANGKPCEWYEEEKVVEQVLSEKQKKFVELCEAEGLEIDYDYSGRGMYGKTCPAVRVDGLDELSFNPNKYCVDNMGRGYVVYCQ